MSQHPSLRISDKDKKQRSVLKRHERIKTLKEKEKWVDEDSVYGLPKVKVTRFKIKKEKAAAVEGAEGAEGAAAPGGASPKAGAAAPAAGAASPKAGAAQSKAGAAPAKAPAGDTKKEAKK